jgi:putative membrane protein
MSPTLRSTTITTLASAALVFAGCSRDNKIMAGMGEKNGAFCANGTSCGGPTYFDANGEIIDHPPGDTYDNRRSDNQSWNNRSDRDRMHSDRSDSNTNTNAWTNSSEDTRILSMLHAKNQKEIEMGRLAQQRASSDEARRLGDTLVRDHSDADSKVLGVAQSANITLLQPNQVHDAMMRDHHANAPTDLNSLPGTDFDRAFAQQALDGHRMCIDEVTAARSKVSNAQVRDLLDALLPTLRHHEEMARQLAGR